MSSAENCFSMSSSRQTSFPPEKKTCAVPAIFKKGFFLYYSKGKRKNKGKKKKRLGGRQLMPFFLLYGKKKNPFPVATSNRGPGHSIGRVIKQDESLF